MYVCMSTPDLSCYWIAVAACPCSLSSLQLSRPDIIKQYYTTLIHTYVCMYIPLLGLLLAAHGPDRILYQSHLPLPVEAPIRMYEYIQYKIFCNYPCVYVCMCNGSYFQDGQSLLLSSLLLLGKRILPNKHLCMYVCMYESICSSISVT